MKQIVALLALSLLVGCGGSSGGGSGVPPAPEAKVEERGLDAQILNGKWSTGPCSRTGYIYERREAHFGGYASGTVWMGMQKYEDEACTQKRDLITPYDYRVEENLLSFWPSHSEYQKQTVNLEFLNSTHIRLNGVDYYKFKSYFP